MKRFRILFAFLGLMLVAGLHTMQADNWDKTTKITFPEAVQVPGKVLAPGTYVFKLLDSAGNRHIVQIFNEDRTALITTILAIPNQRLEPAGKTILTYEERPADQPMALKAWFYPGDNFGQQFVYPKSEAEELSRLNKMEVPSSGSEEAYPGGKRSEPETAKNNGSSSERRAESTPPRAMTAQNEVPTNPAQRPQRLPQTASSLPMVGLIGFLGLSLAVVLRKARRA